MPVLVIYAGVAVSEQEYEHIKNDIGWEATPPAGALLHLVGFDEQDRVSEVTLWESKADHDAYRREHLLPAVRRAGLELPDPRIVPLHGGAIADLADAYVSRVVVGETLGARALA